MEFGDLGLRDALLRAVRERGYARPTTIQARAIPAILGGRDVIAAAPARTGKTAAFALPMLQRLMGVRRDSTGAPRALVIVPTRELALQSAGRVRSYGAHLPFRCSAALRGGDRRAKAKRCSLDVLVATADEVLHGCTRNLVDPTAVELVVLDSIERPLSRGLVRDVRALLALIPNPPQLVMLGATFPDDAVALRDGWRSGAAFIDARRSDGTAGTP